MKYFIFWTAVTTAILASLLRWYHPATISAETIALLIVIPAVSAMFTAGPSVYLPKSLDSKRILHLCLLYPPAKAAQASKIQAVVEATKTTAPDVRVLTSNLSDLSPLTVIDTHLLINDPVWVQRLHHLKIPFFNTPRLQALDHYIAHHKPDAIHVHGRYRQLTRAARKYASRHNVKVIYH